MQINEYTHRETAQGSSLGSVDIRVPEPLRQRNFDGAETALKGLSRIGDVYARSLDNRDKMAIEAAKKAKDSRDKTMSRATFLPFRLAMADQERVQRTTYKRDKAETAVTNYEKYYEDTVNGIMNATKEEPFDLNGRPFYLENEEQKRMFFDYASEYFVNRQEDNIQWWATENAKFSDETNKSSIELNTQWAANADDKKTFEENMSKAEAATLDLNNGNTAVTTEQMKKIKEKAALANIERDMSVNPYSASKKYKELSPYLSDSKKIEAQEAIKKAIHDDQVRKYAEGTFDEAYNDSFYKEFSRVLNITDIGAFRNQIVVDGQKAREELEANKIELETEIAYDATVGLIESKDNQERANYIMSLKQTKTGRENLARFEAYNQNVQKEIRARVIASSSDSQIAGIIGRSDTASIEQAKKDAAAEIERLNTAYVKYIDSTYQSVRDINSGSLRSLNDVSNFDELHPTHQQQILTSMTNKQRYDSFLAKAKTETGASLKNKIGDAFKSTWNKKGSNPVAENIFNVEMSERMIAHFTKNNWRVPTDKELGDMALGVYEEIIPGTIKGRLWDSVRNIVFDSTSEEDRGMLSKSQMIKMVSDAIEDEFDHWYQFTSENEKKLFDKAATYIVDGDIDSAVFLLKDLDK